MQSATSLVISQRMLSQRTSIVNSKDVQYNREVGRHNPVQQQASLRSSYSQTPSPSTRCNVNLAIWLDSHFPELEHNCLPGLKSLAYHNLTLFSSLRSITRVRPARPQSSA
jgi:hypothetical protein